MVEENGKRVGNRGEEKVGWSNRILMERQLFARSCKRANHQRAAMQR